MLHSYGTTPLLHWLGCTVTRLHGYKAARLQGCTVTRLHGCKAARLQGCTITRLHNYKVARVQGCTVTRLHGYKAALELWGYIHSQDGATWLQVSASDQEGGLRVLKPPSKLMKCITHILTKILNEVKCHKNIQTLSTHGKSFNGTLPAATAMCHALPLAPPPPPSENPGSTQ